MVVLVSANDAFGLRLQSDRAGLAAVVPLAALPVNLLAVFVVLDVLAAFADHHLVSTTRLDELEGNVEGSG